MENKGSPCSQCIFLPKNRFRAKCFRDFYSRGAPRLPEFKLPLKPSVYHLFPICFDPEIIIKCDGFKELPVGCDPSEYTSLYCFEEDQIDTLSIFIETYFNKKELT